MSEFVFVCPISHDKGLTWEKISLDERDKNIGNPEKSLLKVGDLLDTAFGVLEIFLNEEVNELYFKKISGPKQKKLSNERLEALSKRLCRHKFEGQSCKYCGYIAE